MALPITTCCPDGYIYGVAPNPCQCWTITSTGCLVTTYSIKYCDDTTGTVILTNNQTVTVCCLSQPTAVSVSNVGCGSSGQSHSILMGGCTLTDSSYSCSGIPSSTCYNTQEQTTDPITCPCCPDNTTYSPVLNATGALQPPCIDSNGRRFASVPCLVCICPTTSLPPICETCINPAVSVAFPYTENIKTCIECGTDDSPRQMNQKKYDNFIVEDLIDPIIIFKRN